MDNQSEQKTYELAFHLLPNLDEAEVESNTQTIRDFVTKLGGSITLAVPAKKTRLSYTIDHHRYSYFGYFHFTSAPSIITQLNAQLKLNNNVLRYIVLSVDTRKDAHVLGQQRERAKSSDSSEPAPSEPKQDKQLDQEIDSVLGNIVA